MELHGLARIHLLVGARPNRRRAGPCRISGRCLRNKFLSCGAIHGHSCATRRGPMISCKIASYARSRSPISGSRDRSQGVALHDYAQSIRQWGAPRRTAGHFGPDRRCRSHSHGTFNAGRGIESARSRPSDGQTARGTASSSAAGRTRGHELRAGSISAQRPRWDNTLAPIARARGTSASHGHEAGAGAASAGR